MAVDERDVHHHRPRQLALMASLLALIAVPGPMHAPAATDGDLDVVADGLSNPRGVDVGPGGRLYVAEAGRGGETRVDVTLGNGTNPICVGDTGAIREIHRHGQRTLTAASSSSAADEDGACPGEGGFATGPQGVAVNGRGKLSFTVGLGAAEATEVRADIIDAFSQAGDLGTAQHLRPHGRTKLLGDLAQFETSNPDGADVDSNPFGIAIDEDGSRMVTDAGGNTLVRLDRHDDPSLVAVFAPRCVESPNPSPIPEDANPCDHEDQFPAQAVPTDSIDGLTAPGGVAVEGHHVYITNFSISPDAGEVVRTSAR